MYILFTDGRIIQTSGLRISIDSTTIDIEVADVNIQSNYKLDNILSISDNKPTPTRSGLTEEDKNKMSII